MAPASPRRRPTRRPAWPTARGAPGTVRVGGRRPAVRPRRGPALAAGCVDPLRPRAAPRCTSRAESFWRDASLRLEYGREDVESYRTWLDAGALRREVARRRGRRAATYLPSLRDPATNRSTREPPRRGSRRGTVLLVSGELLLGLGLPFDAHRPPATVAGRAGPAHRRDDGLDAAGLRPLRRRCRTVGGWLTSWCAWTIARHPVRSRGAGETTPGEPGLGRGGSWAAALMRHRRNVVLAFGAAVLGSAAQTVVPLIARQILDNVVIARRDALWPWLVALFAAAALTFALAYVRRYRGGQVGAGRAARPAQRDARPPAAHGPVAPSARMPTGQLVSRANSDSALVQGLLQLPAADDRQRAADAAVAGRHVRAVAAARPAGARRRSRRCSSSPTGCGGASSPPPGTASSARATSPRSSTRASPASAWSRRSGRSSASSRRLTDAAQELYGSRHAGRPAAGALPAAARGDPDRWRRSRSWSSAGC